MTGRCRNPHLLRKKSRMKTDALADQPHACAIAHSSRTLSRRRTLLTENHTSFDSKRQLVTSRSTSCSLVPPTVSLHFRHMSLSFSTVKDLVGPTAALISRHNHLLVPSLDQPMLRADLLQICYGQSRKARRRSWGRRLRRNRFRLSGLGLLIGLRLLRLRSRLRDCWRVLHLHSDDNGWGSLRCVFLGASVFSNRSQEASGPSSIYADAKSCPQCCRLWRDRGLCTTETRTRLTAWTASPQTNPSGHAECEPPPLNAQLRELEEPREEHRKDPSIFSDSTLRYDNQRPAEL